MINRKMKKQKGLTTIDLVVTIVGIAALAMYFSSKSESTTLKTDEQIFFDTFHHLIESARNTKGTMNDGYASIDVTYLSSREIIAPAFGDGVGTNPHGGDWNFDGSTVSSLVVSATGLEDVLCNRLAERFSRWSSATCTSGTVTVETK